MQRVLVTLLISGVSLFDVSGQLNILHKLCMPVLAVGIQLMKVLRKRVFEDLSGSFREDEANFTVNERA